MAVCERKTTNYSKIDCESAKSKTSLRGKIASSLLGSIHAFFLGLTDQITCCDVPGICQIILLSTLNIGGDSKTQSTPDLILGDELTQQPYI